MMPCSSGNSPTIAVSRSHLPSSAARPAVIRRPPCARRSRAAAPQCGASCRPASRAWPGRSPHRAPARRGASGCRRSWSQKNAASARRGRTTRSLPSRTLAGSRLSMLLTVMNAGSSCAVGILDREIALVVLQRRDQHLARQREEARLEMPGDGHGPLHQRGHLIQQRIADERPAAERVGRRSDLGADLLAAHRKVGQHAGRARAACARRSPRW